MTRSFEQVVAHALQREGVDVSLLELIELCGLDVGDELGSALAVKAKIEPFGLDLFPGFNEGGLRTGRVLKQLGVGPRKDVRHLLESNDESSAFELKSSLVCDVKRLQATGAHVRNDVMVHEVLKTICGFANASGGTLLVGVEDSKNIVGLDNDYRCGIESPDRWQVQLSGFIKGRMLNGERVGPYISVDMVSTEGMDVAVISVVARRELTFVRSVDNKRWEYFVRAGNSTERVDIESFEEHLLRKRGFIS